METAHRAKQVIGQVFRFAVVSKLADRDVTADLREALATKTTKHYAAVTVPSQWAICCAPYTHILAALPRWRQ